MNQKMIDSKIVLLQKIIRGYLCRKDLRTPKDKMSLDIVLNLLENYTKQYTYIKSLNNILEKKKIRQANFPSEISENIVKWIIYYKYNIMPSWNTDTGDLKFGKLIMEVKAFSSNGPTSFGPTESWNIIYFLDATKFQDKIFKLYECRLKNNASTWKNIKVNKNETYDDHCLQGRRPRICFNDLHQQLEKHCKLIFNGKFDYDLFVNTSTNQNFSNMKYTELLKLTTITKKHTSSKPSSRKKIDIIKFLLTNHLKK
jgi:hypothetical protein